MKKIVLTITALALILSAGTVSAFAAGPNNASAQPGCGYCSGFVDTDGDGVCDNLGTRRSYGFVDADGDGICDNLGNGRGYVFTDADGDGVCDNWGSGRGVRRNNT